MKEDLGLELNLANTDYEALQMAPPEIKDGKGVQKPKRGSFWINKFIDKRTSIKKWSVVWERNQHFAESAVDEIIREASNMGITLPEPGMFEMRGNQSNEKKIKSASIKAMKGNPSIILYIIDPMTSKTHYHYIKRNLHSQIG